MFSSISNILEDDIKLTIPIIKMFIGYHGQASVIFTLAGSNWIFHISSKLSRPLLLVSWKLKKNARFAVIRNLSDYNTVATPNMPCSSLA